jgi:S-adenosylmethionine/arginine decarboxylase-like enzyme
MKYSYLVFDLRVSEVPSAKSSELWITNLVEKLGFKVEAGASKVFDTPKDAYSLVFALSASHAVIHTFPEVLWVNVVFAFCHKVPESVVDLSVSEFFKPITKAIRSFDSVPPVLPSGVPSTPSTG